MIGSNPRKPPEMSTDPQDCPTVIHLENWRNGDESAFERLYSRLLPLLRARILRHRAWPLLRTHTEVDDVLQEIWARSARRVKDQFEHIGRGSLLGYLGKIVDRQVIDLARRHKAGKRDAGHVHTLATGFEAADRGGIGGAILATPTGSARTSELMRIVNEELTDREREAWDLVERQGYSAAEAGIAMRATASAIRGLLLRSRTKLIARLGGPRPTGGSESP